MKLNAKKCNKRAKGLFLPWYTPVLEPLTIDGIPIDVVDCHKVLGTVLNSSLKWTVLEYCCPVWHINLLSYLSEQSERLQKRVLRIIFPSLSYREALSAADCVRLDDNRQPLCLNLFQKITALPTELRGQAMACAQTIQWHIQGVSK
jgi:hypothetical protein